MPKLTIAIPTFNGSRTIETAIREIQTAISYHAVDFLISDNCSSDGTQKILERMSFNNKIKVYYQDKNLGYDRNVDFVIKNSNSDYVWLMGDDDIIDKDAINDILSVIYFHEHIDHIFIGGCSVNQKFSILTNKESFFYLTKLRYGGMSTNIIRRSIWLSEDKFLKNYYKTGWIHVAYVLKILASEKIQILVSSKDYRADMPVAKRWSEDILPEQIINLGIIYKELGFRLHGKNVAKAGLLSLHNRRYKDITYKVYAFNKRRKMKDIIKFTTLFKSLPSYWLLTFPTLLAPRPLIVLLYFIHKNFLKKLNYK